MDISIGDKIIGKDAPVFVIAEAACNHMCDLGLAKQMIDEAAKAGADSIKFQTYKAEKLVTDKAVAFWGDEKVSQLEYYKRLDRFGKSDYLELFDYAESKGIIPFSSPFDSENATMLNDIGMKVFKIASCEIPNLEFIRHVAKMGKPIILSTGAASEAEIEDAVDAIKAEGNEQLMLLACTLSYPTANNNANIRRIQTLKQLYPDTTIGFSDHTEPEPNMVIPALAVAMGARIVEKHYTLDRSMTGSGHFFAVSPDDLSRMVYNIRLAEQVLGDGKLGIAESEAEAWHSARRSIVANQSIDAGVKIERAMLSMKRPGSGLPFSALPEIVGRIAAKKIGKDQVIESGMFE